MLNTIAFAGDQKARNTFFHYIIYLGVEPVSTPNVGRLEVSAYTVPTETPEADGTVAWNETTLVLVRISSCGASGLGYSFADIATAHLIDAHLKRTVIGGNCLNISELWSAMVRAIRNLGRPGICSMAISAVDNALWDLKARLLHISVADLLGRAHPSISAYGSGGFTSYSDLQLKRQLKGWIDEGLTKVKIPLTEAKALEGELRKRIDGEVRFDDGSRALYATDASNYRQVPIRMQFSLSGSLATMANGLPYSIGAAVAYPNRQVVCIVGDGGLTMLMGELATLAKYKLNVKVIVVKNNTLGQIKWEQMVFEGNPEFGVELQPIDFAGIAMSCGAAGFTIENPDEAEETLRRALAHDGPAVVQAVVDPNEPPLPGNISTEQFIKFSEAMLKGQKDGWKILKTVMKDKIREVV